MDIKMEKSGCGEEEVKKGPWTPEEDEKLVHYIQIHGASKWRSLPKNAGLKRCGKSCRLRWTNYLRPDIKRGHFSLHEEHTIIHFHSLLGNKWSVIAAQLPGRTDNEIKNYWNTHIKKKLLRMGIDPVTHCPRINLLQLGSILNASLFKSPLQPYNGSDTFNHMFDSTYMNPQILNLLPNLQIDSLQPNQPQNGSNQLNHQTDFVTGLLTSQITSLPVQWGNNVEYSGDCFPYTNSNNRSNVSEVSLTENPSVCIANDDSEDFATWNFGSVLSATAPSSSSTPVNSSATLAFTNGGSEGERKSYGGDLPMVFDHHLHPNALNL